MIIFKIIAIFISIAIMVNGALNVRTETGLVGFAGFVASLIWLFVE